MRQVNCYPLLKNKRIRSLLIISIFIICTLLGKNCNGQIKAFGYNSSIKWDKSIYSNDTFYQIGIDTLTLDTIKLIQTNYFRINRKGQVIEKLDINNSVLNLLCNDDGYHLSGFWNSFHTNGKIKEIGTIACNQKVDEWMYFYENGKIKKYENYLRLELILDSGNNGYLSGVFLEYNESGKLKTSGNYKIVEELGDYYVFDYDTYKEKTECCIWKPTSIKYGIWKNFDTDGRLIEKKDETIDIEKHKSYRELTDGYLERMKNK